MSDEAFDDFFREQRSRIAILHGDEKQIRYWAESAWDAGIADLQRQLAEARHVHPGNTTCEQWDRDVNATMRAHQHQREEHQRQLAEARAEVERLRGEVLDQEEEFDNEAHDERWFGETAFLLGYAEAVIARVRARAATPPSEAEKE